MAKIFEPEALAKVLEKIERWRFGVRVEHARGSITVRHGSDKSKVIPKKNPRRKILGGDSQTAEFRSSRYGAT
jgi:hypothetical protein